MYNSCLALNKSWICLLDRIFLKWVCADKQRVSEVNIMTKRKQKKPDWMKKSSHPGIACRKGQAICYEEVKTNINLTLTPTALDILKELAMQMKISRSEIIERWLRGENYER